MYCSSMLFEYSVVVYSAYEWIKLNKYLTQPVWWLMKLLMCDIIGGDSVIWSLDDDDAVGLAMGSHLYLSRLHQWLFCPICRRSERKKMILKMKYDVSFFLYLLRISQRVP